MSDILQRGGKQALIGIGPGHCKENTPDALDYPGSDFEQFESEGVDCGHSQLSPGKAAAQVPQQNEGKVQQQPKLVCLKPGAAQPVGFEMKFEFLDPVFGIAAAGVDAVINPRGRFKEDIGYNKAGVESSGEPLDLGNNPT